MATIRVNGVDLGVESFGREDDPLVLLVGGTTMLSWPDSLCERVAEGGRRVVRYDLRDSGVSSAKDPENPTYDLRDLAEEAAEFVTALGANSAHLAGIGVGGMVAQVAALDHPENISALTLVSTRPVAPGPVDDDLPDHDQIVMSAVFSRPQPDWTDRRAVAEFAAEGAALLGDDVEQARATAARIWDRTPDIGYVSPPGESAGHGLLQTRLLTTLARTPSRHANTEPDRPRSSRPLLSRRQC